MRVIVDLVDSLTGTVRFVICAIVLSGIALSFFMTAGISYVAPKVAEDYGERAERLGERAIIAAQEEARARELAKDGWGYEEPGSSGSFSDRSADAGGWGDDTN